jgi:hypothetical protein
MLFELNNCHNLTMGGHSKHPYYQILQKICFDKKNSIS